MLIRTLDLASLREDYKKARPFPFVKIENFLEPAFADEVAVAYPSFEDAVERGRTFKTVNEQKKVQITDAKLFPNKIAQLNEALASPAFLEILSYVSGLPGLVADKELTGGGMHITGAGGRLDVHVDFNYLKQRALHRRLNLLLYLNPIWRGEWGGHLQLWDKDVKTCEYDFEPVLNRCIIFETSEYSFHGVTPVTGRAPFPRISFAAYYYTREAPSNWRGNIHSTIFKARPEERLRRYVLMPSAVIRQHFTDGVRQIKREIKRLVNAERR
jgi:hypothetical protein